MPRRMKTTSPGQIVRKSPRGCVGFNLRHRRCIRRPRHVPVAHRGAQSLRSTHGRSPTDSCSMPSARRPSSARRRLALILGEPHATVHRSLADLLAEGIVGRVSHGTAHLPSSQRYHLTAQGVGEAAWVLGFGTASDFVRAYPMAKEWLTLLIRRMDAVASIYRLAASMSPGIDGLRSPRRVPPQRPLRRHYHPPRRPQLWRGPAGSRPAAPVSLRPAEGHS